MRIGKEIKFTFDDVLLRPQYSEIKSRSDVDLSTELGTLKLKLPIISANMDTVTGVKMAHKMQELGGLGVIHRYEDPEKIKDNSLIPSVGVKDADIVKARRYYELGFRSICIDVANGNSLLAVNMVSIVKLMGFENIIAGNVATRDGVIRLNDAGANIIKCGIGSGSICSTRLVSGTGVPQLSAIIDCADVKTTGRKLYIIADGGIRHSGDIVKALASGADSVMVGRLLAGCDECPRNGYRGMASFETQMEHLGKVSNDMPEGETIKVDYKGPVKGVIDRLAGGIRSGLSYSGVNSIKDLQEYAILDPISNNTLTENGIHGRRGLE